mgnify:CR=1 FL=1
MGSIAFALPISTGQADHLFDHVEHITGPGRDEHHERSRRHGFTNVRLYHQTQPQEILIVYLEAPNLDKSIEEMRNSPDLSEQPWVQLIANLGDHRPEHLLTPKPQLVMDWHHEEGHRHKPARRA